MKAVMNYFSFGIGSPEFKFAFIQGMAHFSGLMFGIGFFFFLGWIKPILTKRKRYALRRGG